MHETLGKCKHEHYFRYDIADEICEDMGDISSYNYKNPLGSYSITKWIDDEDYYENSLRSAKRHASIRYFSVCRSKYSIYDISLAYLPISREVRTMMLRYSNVENTYYEKEGENEMNYAMRNYLKNEMDHFGIGNLAKMYAFDTVTKGIKVRYGEELYLYDANDIRTVSEWISKYDSKYQNRPKNNRDTLDNCQFLFKLEANTYGFVQVGTYVSKFDFLANYANKESDIIKIYIFGRKYRNYVKELKTYLSHNNNNNLYIYNVQGKDNGDGVGVKSIGRTMERRDLSTLFYNDNIKETVCAHIDNFLANKSIYESKSLNHKTGILLYGDPGTGKTSMAMALCNQYNYNLIVIDMNTFDQLDVGMLTSCINADTDKFIVLLEDIDTLFNTLNREDGNIEKDEKAIINKMLQFLDSSSSPSDVVFIATTNHIEALDHAITRDGRFDLKVEVKNIDKSVAIEMIESFDIHDKEAIDKILDSCDWIEGKINPASLQNKILAYFKEEMRKDEE